MTRMKNKKSAFICVNQRPIKLNIRQPVAVGGGAGELLLDERAEQLDARFDAFCAQVAKAKS